MTSTAKPLSKGQKTAQRILDAAEILFATRGFDGTSLRQITQRAGITEPGLYNHFDNKQVLYAAVLDRALRPMSEAMEAHLSDTSVNTYTELPSIMTDILCEHPRIAALFQLALHGDQNSVGNQLVIQWLDKLLGQGVRTIESAGIDQSVNHKKMVIYTLGLFNLTTGYFLAQPVFGKLTGSDILDRDNIQLQKELLGTINKALLNG